MKYIYKFTVRSVSDRPDRCSSIIVYVHNPNLYHFQYTDNDKVATIKLPYFIDNMEISNICHECNALADEGKELHDVRDYIRARIEYARL